MSRVLADLISYEKQYLRKKSAAFFTFFFPILLILVFGAIFSSDGMTKMTLPVQNLDDGSYSQPFLEAMNQTGYVKITMIADDVDLEDYISEESLSVVLLIPSNFSSDLETILATQSPEFSNITLYGDPSQSTFQSVLSIVNTAEAMMNFHFAQARPLVLTEVKNIGSDSYSSMDYFLPGVVGITVMTTAMYGMTAVCAEYKSRGYTKLLATTTLTKQEWLLSKILANTIMLVVSLVTTVCVGWLAFGLEVTITPMTLVLVLGGTFLFTSAGMLLGSVAKDAESGSAVASAIGFPMMFLSGAFFPVELFPDFLRVVAKCLPMTYMNDGLRDAMLFANNISAATNLTIVVVIGAVLFVAGSMAMSWKAK